MTCPLCRQPTTMEGNHWRPFCSERCQLTDLGAWATEQYRLSDSTLTTDTSFPDSSEGNDDTEKQQQS